MEPPQIHRIHQMYSDKSRSYKKLYFGLILIELTLAVLIAALALVLSLGIPSVWRQAAFGVVALAFLLSILVQSYSSWTKVERKWFLCRAVAESMKALSWRYCSRAGEYQGNDEAVHSAFLQSLQELEREASKRVTLKFPATTVKVKAPLDLASLRSQGWEQRRETYLAYRMNDQVLWYQDQTRKNSLNAKLFSGTVVTIQLLGIAMALYFLVIGSDVTPFVALVVTLITSLLAWKQTRQYAELVEPYSIASTELQNLRQRLRGAGDESEFSSYVVESELAISREHSTWLARRGIPVKLQTAS